MAENSVRWPLRIAPMVGLAYLSLVVAPYYLNGIAGQPASMIGSTDAWDPKMFVPFSLPGGKLLLGFAGALTLLGPLVLPVTCLVALATIVWSDWPREARRERRREVLVQGITVLVPTVAFFVRWRDIINWFGD